jgi:hypothetical protein
VRLYRARGWRGGGAATFDPLDSRGSISGPLGWRFNDPKTEILYTAEVEALATLEVAARPGWEGVRQVLIATIEIPDGAIANPADLGLTLPTNWNANFSTPSRGCPRGVRGRSACGYRRWSVRRTATC